MNHGDTRRIALVLSASCQGVKLYAGPQDRTDAEIIAGTDAIDGEKGHALKRVIWEEGLLMPDDLTPPNCARPGCVGREMNYVRPERD